MQQILFQGINLNDFKNLISEVIDEKLKNYHPKEPISKKTNYLSRFEVAKLLRVSLATLHDWSKRGIVQSYRIGNRVLYKQDEIERSLVTVANLKYKRG